jgi:hypothetical protein
MELGVDTMALFLFITKGQEFGQEYFYEKYFKKKYNYSVGEYISSNIKKDMENLNRRVAIVQKQMKALHITV